MEKNTISLQIVNPKAAGIDVGSRIHVVAVNQNVDNVRSFGIYTKDYHDMIEFLRNHEINTVAMESTGSYWQTLFSALQESRI
jgi:transposase